MKKDDHIIKIKMEEETSFMLIVSDDIILVVENANDLQILVIDVKEDSEKMKLTLNIKTRLI